ncbi:MAG TPA: nitrate- and nitrite sensing domain-containing protein [Steroidobacteraceae bacterium]
MTPTIHERTEDTGNAVAARFLRAARLCRTRDLEQLSILGELVGKLSELIHALQKERGAASIFLGSNGAQFAERLTRRVGECRALEQAVRERLEHVDEKLDRMSSGSRFYTRVALALRALDTLPVLRQQIAALAMAPLDSVRAFTLLIGALLAVGFEVGDIAADPAVCKVLVALVNLAQAKEYAGQERATVGAALSSGLVEEGVRQRMQQLSNAQDGALRIFMEFSAGTHIDAFNAILASRNTQEVGRLRHSIGQAAPSEAGGAAAAAWYRHTTRRIDALHAIEDALSQQLGGLCSLKLKEARASAADAAAGDSDDILATGPVGVLLAGADGIDLYTLEDPGPKPMRSILFVIQAQARRIDDVSAQLESARAALGERKVIDRAKGLLMSNRNLTEADAYSLMRETAMRQNRRIVDIAESIVSMADILKA